MSITLHGAALLLGTGDDPIRRAADRGWLPARRRRRRGYRYVTAAALRQFAADPRCWLIVAPEDIPDPELRAVALAARRAMPDHRWWSVADLARAYIVHPSVIRIWRRHGWGEWTWYGHAAYLWAAAPPPPRATVRGAYAPQEIRHAAAD